MITDKNKTPEQIFIQEDMGQMVYGVDQDENILGMVKYIRCDIAECADIQKSTSETDRVKEISDVLLDIIQSVVANEHDHQNFGDEPKSSRYFYEEYLPKLLEVVNRSYNDGYVLAKQSLIDPYKTGFDRGMETQRTAILSQILTLIDAYSKGYAANDDIRKETLEILLHNLESAGK